MSYPEIQHSSFEGEVPSSDVMALQQSLQHKHEQLILSTEVVNQLTQQTQRQSLSIHILSTKLTDSQFRIDALDSEIRDQQHRINHLTQHYEASQLEVSSLSEKLIASNEQISSQRNSLQSMHHTLHHQEAQHKAAMEHYRHKKEIDGQRLQKELVEMQQKYTASLVQCDQLKIEKKRMKRERAEMGRHNKFIEQFVSQMTVENMKLHKKANGLGTENQAMMNTIDALRAENKSLLDRVSEFERDEEDQDHDRIDECIQVDITEKLDSLCIDAVSTAETMDQRTAETVEAAAATNDIADGDDLLTVVQQYEDHQEYLDGALCHDTEAVVEDEQEIDDEMDSRTQPMTDSKTQPMTDSKVESMAGSTTEQRAGSKTQRQKVKVTSLSAKALMEVLQREEMAKKNAAASRVNKRTIWEFFASRIDTAMSWI